MTALPPGWTRSDPAVICLGLSAYDHIWTMPVLPQGAGKNRAKDFVSTGGGMAATAAVTIARIGGRAQFWGRAGDDVAGHAMMSELEREGVDCTHFRLFAGGQSSASCVLVDPEGERTIVNFRGGGLPEDAGWLPVSEVAQAGAVLADPRWPEGAARLFSTAREAGVPTVLDADVAEADVFDRLLPLTDHAIFSAQALAAYAGEKDALEKVAVKGCRVTAVTRGAEGVTWLEDGQRHHCPAVKVTVADTTGAGDVFHGAWAYAIAAGASTAEAASFASAVAALKCKRPTGRAGIPNLSESLDLWRQNA